MAISKAQAKAQLKYDAKATTQFKMKLNLKTDADILAKLDQVENKQGYIKELIRRDIAGAAAVDPTPVIDKFIVDGKFELGEFVTVSIDGRTFKRKVINSSVAGDLAITIYNNIYARSEFK